MLTEKYEEYIKEVKEVMSTMMAKIIAEGGFSDIDEESLGITVKMFKLVDSSYEIVLEQARSIDRLEEKMNKLLALASTK